MNPERIQVFLSLGSNCAEARQMLARAREAIAALPGAGIIAKSPVYLTEPQGYSEQPWFSNQVIALAVAESWRPPALLAALLAIENSLGRKRDLALRFGPRKIDIDLLLFGDEKSSDLLCSAPCWTLPRKSISGDARLRTGWLLCPTKKPGKKSGNENICRDPFSFGSG